MSHSMIDHPFLALLLYPNKDAKLVIRPTPPNREAEAVLQEMKRYRHAFTRLENLRGIERDS